MRIPVGNFGNEIAAPAPRVNIPDGAFGDFSGLKRLGDTGAALAGDAIAEQRLEARRAQAREQAEAKRMESEREAAIRRDENELRSAKRMQAYAAYNADIDEYSSSLITGLSGKTVKRDEVMSLFESGAKEIEKRRMEGLDPISQETVRAHMITGQRGALNRLRTAVEADIKHEKVAVIATAAEDMQRLGVKDPQRAITQFNALMDSQGASVFGADQVVKQKQAFAERVYASHFTTQLSDIVRNPDLHQRQGRASFDAIIPGVLQREGGFVSRDGAGGAPANFGINQAANPDIDVRNLTPEKAKQIYLERYWNPIGADKLPAAAAVVAFDAAVNQGVGYAQDLLKKTGGDPQKMIEQRIADYRALARDPKHAPFLGGWLNRMQHVKREAEAANNASGFTALADRVASNQVIDPDRKTAILSSIASQQQRMATAAESAERGRMSAIQDKIKAVDGMILQGFEPTADQMMALSQEASGTYFEPVVQGQIQFAASTSRFRAMAPAGQEQAINEMEAAVRASPSPDGIKTLTAMRTIYGAQSEAVKKDPQSFAAQKGLAAVEPIDFTKMATLGEQVRKRVDTARAMRSQYGSPMQVFTSQEADSAQKLIAGLAPAQKLGILQTLAAGIGDPMAMRDTAAQMAEKDKGLGTAMFLAGKGYFTERGRNLAELYLQGQDAIASKAVKIDPNVVSDLAKRLDGVYATSSARDTAVDVALHVYAAGQAKGLGGLDLSDAVGVATGGIMEHNGSKIAKPYGWEDIRFRDRLKAITPQMLAAQGGQASFRVGGSTMTAEALAKALPGARLQTVGDGQYSIISGADYVRLDDNLPLVIEVR